MSSSLDNYKIPDDFLLEVSDFFKKFHLCSWNLENYYSYILKSQPDVKIRKAKEMFNNDLDHLKSTKDLDRGIKSKISQISTKSVRNSSGKPNSMMITHNHGVTISESSNFKVVNYSSDRAQNDEREQKKQKINHTIEGECRKVHNNDNFWEAWRQYLAKCEDHNFCTEKFFIIECGYSISCYPSYPEQLYDQLNINSVKSIFITFSDYTKLVLEAFATKSQRRIRSAVDDDSIHNEMEARNKAAKFAYDFFEFCSMYFKNNTAFDINKAAFNHEFVWPFMQLAVNAVNKDKFPGVKFMPGEVKLKASEEEYNASGIVTNADGIEICLLETSGPFKLIDRPRFGYDHVKGSFGVLSMMNAVVKKYFYATIETLMTLKIYFIHVRETKVFVCALELSVPKAYNLNCIASFDIPTTSSESKEVLDFGNCSWLLRKNLENTCHVIDSMKKEHDNYQLSLRLGGTQEKRENLLSFVDKAIQKPGREGQYGLLLPSDLNENELNYTVAAEE